MDTYYSYSSFSTESNMESNGGRSTRFVPDIGFPDSSMTPKASGPLTKLMNIPFDFNNLDFGLQCRGIDQADFVNPSPNLSQDDNMEKMKFEGNFKESPMKECHLEWEKMALSIGRDQLNRDVLEHQKKLKQAVTKIKTEAKEERDIFIKALVQEVDDFKLPRAQVLLEDKKLDEKIAELQNLCGECLNLDTK